MNERVTAEELQEGKTFLSSASQGTWLMSANHVYTTGENGANVCTVGSPRHSNFVGYDELKLNDRHFSEAISNVRLIVWLQNNAAKLIEAAEKTLDRDDHAERGLENDAGR